MGIWEEEHKNKNIMIGDDGLDILHDAVEKFYKMSKEHLDREPALDEFFVTLLHVLNTNGDSFFPELNERQITDIKASTKKAKSLSKIVPGAIIEIPLEEINKYSYAWVLEGNLAKRKDDDVLIQYYDIFVDQKLSKAMIRDLLKEENKLFVANTSYTGFLQDDWKVVSKATQDLLKQYDESKLRFITYEEGKYFISEGKEGSLGGDDVLTEVDQKTGRAIYNPIGIFGHLCIETILMKYSNGISMEDIIKYET
ncbi:MULTISPECIES: hypothetical protein [Bacillus]|uniref:hypothetical protein n=1 Tax=Bacillus TaxID=1386 RepID=UPI000504E060|nr:MULTISPECIES: hypothetical protein [Bacillus]POO81811.1 hypothetical protein C1T30_16585 [Bacillus sp. MBGLi97]KAA0835488.1 hypothetical protein EI979_18705 [Bacillus paralicheniformis]KAA0842539.1 hypothetical protein EI977_05010 [Bacillus paralicheniformis]KFM84295.1 immunity 14 family protein [Bacillus paralicheniformis]MBR8665791.1 hypothetical protein [Bacillus paralicheniformis]